MPMPADRPDADRTITASDQGRRRRVLVGQVVELRLDDNVTTGYRWVLDDPAAHVLLVQDHGHDPSAGIGGRAVVGAAGVSWWRLVALAPGVARLSARRLRPWEGEASVVDRFTSTLEVRAPRPGAPASDRDAKMR